MTHPPLKTALVGFGRIASGYAEDPVMARYYRYATHAQVLAEHPAFDWIAVVDPDPSAREFAHTRWSVPIVAESVAALGAAAADIEVVVLATRPETRLHALDAFPNARVALVEKPLGVTYAESAAFLHECRSRNVQVQVNLWRRADRRFRALAAGELAELVGDIQCASGVYGNGLANNGTHLVDFVRMLLGEVVAVECVGHAAPFEAGPIPGDVNPTFGLTLQSGAVVTLHPLRFEYYRENGLDIWGTDGRLAILNEGLTLSHYARDDNRAMTGEREIVCDAPQSLESTVGNAFYHMFGNMADAVNGTDELWSPGDSALRCAQVVDATLLALRTRTRVNLDEATFADAALR